MYSETENALLPADTELHPVTTASFELAQIVGMLADSDVTLVAVPGELPQIAVGKGN